MKLSVQLSQKDWVAYNQYLIKKLSNSHKTWLDNQFVKIPFWVVISLLLMFLFNLNGHLDIKTALVVSLFFIIFILITVFNIKLKQKAYYPKADGVFVGEHQFVIDEFGIQSSGNGYHGHNQWKLVKKIERISQSNIKLILIYLDTAYAFIFPENQLENADDFYHQLTQYYQQNTLNK